MSSASGPCTACWFSILVQSHTCNLVLNDRSDVMPPVTTRWSWSTLFSVKLEKVLCREKQLHKSRCVPASRLTCHCYGHVVLRCLGIWMFWYLRSKLNILQCVINSDVLCLETQRYYLKLSGWYEHSSRRYLVSATTFQFSSGRWI